VDGAGDSCPVRDLGWATEAAPIAAVLVMADPHGCDWYTDLQLLLDVITSHGVPMRHGPTPQSEPVELVFSNPDILWAARYPRPRLGQGAFSAALDALHRQVTGGAPLPRARWFGKPNPEPYRLAEQQLVAQALQLGLLHPTAAAAAACGTGSTGAAQMFHAIFAVGDNPAADVRGANRAGPPWTSVLVRTGVFQGMSNCEADPAQLVLPDVLAAVRAGLHRARSVRWHSMR
jgi:HAD superfamily hydrolase (TIGR01456 family)